jgi:hypothetical protein
MHRDSIEIACEEPIEQDSNTGELSLKIGNGLQVSNNKLITRLGNGLEFNNGTDGQKAVQVKLQTGSGLTCNGDGLKVTNAINAISPATTGVLQSITIGTNIYTIPQGQTYSASNEGITLNNTTFKLLTSDGLAIGVGDTGTNKYLRIALADSSGLNFDDSLPGKLSIKLANNSGLDKSNGLKIKVNATSGLELTSDGLKMKYPLPSITGNKEKILAINSAATGLE